MTEPDSKLTYGQIVGYILDKREVRLNKYRGGNGKLEVTTFWKNLLDFTLVTSMTLNMIAYAMFINLQMV